MHVGIVINSVWWCIITVIYIWLVIFCSLIGSLCGNWTWKYNIKLICSLLCQDMRPSHAVYASFLVAIFQIYHCLLDKFKLCYVYRLCMKRTIIVSTKCMNSKASFFLKDNIWIYQNKQILYFYFEWNKKLRGY